MSIATIGRICPQCNGSGVYNRVGEIIDPCPCCNGSKYIDSLYDLEVNDRHDELLAKLNDILSKWNVILTGYNNIITKLDQIIALLTP